MSDNLRDEITPEPLYLSRRRFMTAAGAVAAGAVVAACGAPASPSRSEGGIGGSLDGTDVPVPTIAPDATEPKPGPVAATTDELGDALTPFDDITHYNNYYEFGTDKSDPKANAADFQTCPGRSRSAACARTRALPSTICSSRPTRGSRLPPALRGGVVDGDPVGRVSAGATA